MEKKKGRNWYSNVFGFPLTLLPQQIIRDSFGTATQVLTYLLISVDKTLRR